MKNEILIPNQQPVFALVYENSNEFIHEDDDIRRELVGVYESREEAQQDLDMIEDQTHYKIEVWENDMAPF